MSTSVSTPLTTPTTRALIRPSTSTRLLADPAPVPAVNAPGTGVIYSWDTSIGVDGPGTRFVVFTSGCSLRCVYCANPESWLRSGGRTVTVADVMAELARYERFIAVAGGGLTVTGGEPLAQPAFLAELMHAAKARGIHTALDTSGNLGDDASDELLLDIDLVLLDIKSWDPATYHRVTRRELEPTLRLARRLAALRRPVWLRFVLVPGWTDDEANVDGVAAFAAGLGNVERVDVLPFHRMALDKYQALGIVYPTAGVEPPSPELLARVVQQFRDHGLETH